MKRVVAAVLGVLLGASAAFAEAPGSEGSGAVGQPMPLAEGSAEGSGSGAVAVGPVVVRVRAVRIEPSTFRDVGIAGQDVDVHVVVPPHEIVATYRVRTDAEGYATAMVDYRDGAEVTADADVGTRIFSGSQPLRRDGVPTLELRIRERTGDPSVVRASRVMTLVELWEGFLTVQQVFTLETSNGAIWSTESPGAMPLRVELPEDAEGIRVMMPQSGAVVEDNVVLFHGEITAPDSAAERRPSLIIRYSLPHERTATHVFEQRLTMDVAAMSVVIPRETEFERHPRLDIELTVPMCDDPLSAADGRMCFTEITDDASDLPINEGVDVIVARGGTGVSGETVRVVSAGWPSRVRWEFWTAIGLGGLAALAGLGFAWVEVGRRRRTNAIELERRALERRRDDLLNAVAELEEAWQRGEVMTRDRDAGRERLREQLGITRRRLRELESGVSESAPA